MGTLRIFLAHSIEMQINVFISSKRIFEMAKVKFYIVLLKRHSHTVGQMLIQRFFCEDIMSTTIVTKFSLIPCFSFESLRVENLVKFQ